MTHDNNQTHSYNLTFRSDKESALTYAELDNNFRYFEEAIQSSEGYVHDSGDGNLHVPATSTSNNGKVLTAGTTAGSLSWTTPASTYTLPTASSSVLGGIKVGTNLTISNGVLSSTDTNTQLSDANIAAMGYIKVDTNTQLSDAEIAAMGYIKVDTNTTYSGGTGITLSGTVFSTTAEANVQSNWNESNTSVDSYIQNKPTVPTSFAPVGAEVNVQSNWNHTDPYHDGYIQNKPNVFYTAAIPDATNTQTGLATYTQIAKLDGIATNANKFIHETSDGNLHVPATSTSNNGKVLTAGTTAGSLSWEDVTVTATGNFVPSDSSSTITGTLTATDFIISSDRRLKSNIKNLERGVLHLLSEINPVTFNDGDIGFIAQDFEDRVPELVSSGDDGYLALKYSKITALLWKQNQELLKRIEVLENR